MNFIWECKMSCSQTAVGYRHLLLHSAGDSRLRPSTWILSEGDCLPQLMPWFAKTHSFWWKMGNGHVLTQPDKCNIMERRVLSKVESPYSIFFIVFALYLTPPGLKGQDIEFGAFRKADYLSPKPLGVRQRCCGLNRSLYQFQPE